MAWTNSPLRLYHGTTDVRAAAILAAGIDTSKFHRLTDFGPGFYTTTKKGQAFEWAYKISEKRKLAGSTERPAVLAYEVDRESLAGLQAICFVRAAEENGYWDFVRSCRRPVLGQALHARHSRTPYDLAIGPVARVFLTPPYKAINESDQISFHSDAALALLKTPSLVI